MNEPILVIMAAGMGSRYGGLKQIDPIDKQGNLIIDFSIYDAIQAGFKKVVFIIKRKIESEFKEVIGKRIEKYIEVKYVYQEIDNLPEEYQVPQDRVKPWGTGHAILSAAEEINGPFAVINADDYYGQDAFKLIYNELIKERDQKPYPFCMVGYSLKKTMTEYGHVARGITEVSEDGFLQNIEERTHIEKRMDGIQFTPDEGETWVEIEGDRIVSMNLWGFTTDILVELKDGFEEFLDKEVKMNPLKSEFFLPSIVNTLVESEKARVKVLSTQQQWYGMTYKEDKKLVMDAIQQYKGEGKYPDNLWN